jgi:hypothetical protein
MTIGLTLVVLAIIAGWSLRTPPSLQIAENTSARRK